jgi:AraC-like DNA-binding protein
MAEILQKSAKLDQNARQQQLLQSGILAPTGFDKHFNVKGYTAADNLASFISHYWVMRWDVPEGEAYRPTEILSQPVTHIFFTRDDAFIYGVINGTFDYEARGKGAIAGITFRPGGFYPFLGKSMDTLADWQKTPLSSVFPDNIAIDITQSDEQIVAAIEALLQAHVPPADPNVAFVQQIVEAIVVDNTLTTVEEVAKRFHKSERTLQLLFQTYVGVGVKWVIMRVRLLEAVKHAYAAGRPNWALIAADLGYSSQAHFINDFKRVVGKAPAQFIKELT